MRYVLGVDTSNYTTSIAAFDLDSGTIIQSKKLLPVSEGSLGLRQSDAVFHHTKQLPDVVEKLDIDSHAVIEAIGASDRPCSKDKSYMPCFLVGTNFARSFSSLNHIPLSLYTHQQGHIAAAAYGANSSEILKDQFLAFHVSGGTTDLLLVSPDKEKIINCNQIGCSLDLKAGQLIDRVGNMLGISFPSGPAMDQMIEGFVSEKTFKIKPTMENGNCHLSGVENQCKKMIEEGYDKKDVIVFCLLSIYEAVSAMTVYAKNQYGDLPVLFAGGVMSNSLLQKKLSERFDGIFSPPSFSSDNACGIAWLTAQRRL